MENDTSNAGTKGAQPTLASPSKTETEVRAIAKWQQSLRRFMMGTIIFAFMLFAVSVVSITAVWRQASTSQDFEMSFSSPNHKSISTVQSEGKKSSFNYEDQLEYTQWATRSLLEKNLIERRYNQAKLSLITRTWISYIGFITGMLLALIGATFVLGKLSDTGIVASIEGASVKGNLQSTSPGIVLAILGTILMGLTMNTEHKIDVDDISTYLPTSGEIVKTQKLKNPPDEGDKTPPKYPTNTDKKTRGLSEKEIKHIKDISKSLSGQKH